MRARFARDEPAWWYGDAQGVVPALLGPAAALYGRLAAARLTARPRYRSCLPVICIGNFTAGGNGKTPLTLHIAARLIARGARPALLTRGYGGRIEGPHWVAAGQDVAAHVGDEALLLAGVAPTLVARRRDAGARSIDADPRGFTHILMDDGLQNPQLAKSLRIAVVDAGKGLGNGRIIPAGPLRAPLDVQLRATDVVVLNSMTAHDTAGQIEVLTTRLRAAGFTGKVLTASVQATGDPGWLRGQTVVAVSGIARPERFHALLEAAGAHLVAREAFPDHHPFDQADARRLLTVAEAAGAAIVTTAKDAARLSGSTGALADLRRAARVVEIALQMPPDAAAGLEACLAAAAPVT